MGGKNKKNSILQKSEKKSVQNEDKNISKELNETLNKIPELTKEYFRIPSLPEEQKQAMQVGESIEGRVKEKSIWYIENKKYPIIILKKYIEGKEENAVVREFVDGIPEKFKGIQFFNKAAAKNLNLMKLLPTHGNLVKIVGERFPWRSDAVYQKNNELIKKFIIDSNLVNAGMYSANNNDFVYIDSFRYHLMSANERTIEINTHDDKIERGYAWTNKDHWFPIMLLKK